jgi:TonB family protein
MMPVMNSYHGLLSLSAVLLLTFNAFAQAGVAADSLVSKTFDRHQYLNSEDGVTVPKALEVPDPEYPWTAQRRGIQGTIVLAIAINKNGGIDNVKVVRRLDPDLDQAAVDAVKRWRFAPAEKDGEAVPFQTRVEVRSGFVDYGRSRIVRCPEGFPTARCPFCPFSSWRIRC